MADITTACSFTRVGFALGQSKFRKVFITTPATADSTDTITLDKAAYGTILSIVGFDTDTAAQEQPTWVVATGVITITGSSNDNKARLYEVTVV